MRVLLPLLLMALSTFADPEGLLHLGLNERGAEEWYRVRDGATVIRVPGGAYRKRPYEGDGTTLEPTDVEVASYFIDKYEVTNAQYARFLNADDDARAFVNAKVKGLTFDGKRWGAAPGLENHPVTAMNGHGALAYARWVGGDLPTPDQWEKAAGGVEGRLYPWGTDAPDARHANFGRPGLRGTLPVGSHPVGASPYGCLDMAGNVYERCWMRRGDSKLPIMIKGGSWLSPHPINLRVLDMCVQGMPHAEASVGFRCVMTDPEPDRKTRKASPPPRLKLAVRWEDAVAEARRRNVPIFLSLQFDTCGQCDRTRAQMFRDPRFIAYCNQHLVVAVGHKAGDALEDPHPEGPDEACPFYPGLECWEHEAIFNKAIFAIEVFRVSPGNFVLDPHKVAEGLKRGAILIPEMELPKWGNAVEEYLAAFERARGLLRTATK